MSEDGCSGVMQEGCSGVMQEGYSNIGGLKKKSQGLLFDFGEGVRR